MADSAGMSIQPAEVAEVSRQLDELADRVQRVLQDETTNLTVTAAGRDEVSQRVASTFNEVHTTVRYRRRPGPGRDARGGRDIARPFETMSRLPKDFII